jgi:fatty-acyl-CoA synthase
MAEFPDLDEHTRATTFYTTGTTGLPKAVSFSHRQIVLHTVANTASLASISGGPRFHAGDVYMPLTPMFHVHAWGIPYIATFLGIKQVYAGRYIPAVINRLITTEKVTFSHCVPTILAMLVRDPGNAEVDYSNWKVIIGGAALPRSLAAAALDRGINVFAGYGMSETGPVVSFVRLDREALALGREEQLALRVRTGTPVGLTYVKVVDNNGQEAPWDDRTPGEIVLRCPWLTHGYDKDSINSERLWEGGWLHTQDVAVRSPEGSLRITDRLKDVVKVGGEWVSSLEMEDMIALHPEVDDCAVISCADERWGEIPLAVVVPRQAGRLGERDVVRHVRTYVDSGVLPREALLVKVILCDGLDKTSVGKTDKVALRTRYAHSP